MSKLRKRNVKTDRLSELPDSLIFDIFGSLPMTDVVQTTLLSKRWKNLWTTAPYLDFSDKHMQNLSQFRDFVNSLIRSWRGAKIMRFNLSFDLFYAKMLADDVDSWLHFATEKKVEDLIFCSRWHCLSEPILNPVPQFLYSCSSLKDLCLRNCDLQIHGNVQWCQLKKLEIDGLSFSENAINQVLLGSPKLECFSLTLRDSKEKYLSIRSTSLRMLRIRNLLFYVESYMSMGTEVRIWTPNLETFKLEGVSFSKCLLMSALSLVEARLLIHPGLPLPRLDDYVGEAITQTLATINHVPRVQLSNWCIKVLGAVKKKQMLTSFPNAKLLELIDVCLENYQGIVDLLKMFPNLRNLVIQTVKVNAESCLKFESNGDPSLYSCHLKTVDITWFQDDESIFPLIEILLKYARAGLEKLVLRRDKRMARRTPWKALFSASQKLLRMQRFFPNVELILC